LLQHWSREQHPKHLIHLCTLKDKPFRAHQRYLRHPAFLSGLSLEFNFGIQAKKIGTLSYLKDGGVENL
jgi:hypothetical protein